MRQLDTCLAVLQRVDTPANATRLVHTPDLCVDVTAAGASTPLARPATTTYQDYHMCDLDRVEGPHLSYQDDHMSIPTQAEDASLAMDHVAAPELAMGGEAVPAEKRAVIDWGQVPAELDPAGEGEGGIVGGGTKVRVPHLAFTAKRCSQLIPARRTLAARRVPPAAGGVSGGRCDIAHANLAAAGGP